MSSLPGSTPSSRADSTVVIDGRGFGHGVGMAQDGAYWMGRSGRSASQILQTFYPGTTLSRRGGAIRVPLAVASTITVRLSGAGSIGGTRIPANVPVSVSTREGGFRVTVGVASSDPEAPSDDSVPLGVPIEATSGEASVTVPVVPAPAPAPVDAPASVGFAAAASPARFVARVFGAVQAQDPATSASVTVPVVASTAPASTVAAPTVVAPPVVVVTPVEPTPTTAAANPNTVVVAEVPVTAVGTVPAGEAVTTAVPGQPAAVPGGDAAAATTVPGSDPVSVGAGSGGGRQSTFNLDGARVEITSAGLIGMAGRRFRGSLELANRGGSVRVVNIVDVEQYLRGMGEILYRDWPAATLQAQAIAARTYAIRMMGNIGEVCPTQACQVYLGAQVEYPQMDAAVEATRGQVVTYKGSLANTFYSASGGGTIADPSEGFGGNLSVPYLQAGVYPTGDLKAWTVSMSLGEVARRVGYRGSPTSVAITNVGPSGRAKEVTVYGSSGALRVPGPRFDAALGLRSTFFTFRGSGVGMSPLPEGAVSAAEVLSAAPPEGDSSAGGFAPTLSQSPFLLEEIARSADVATGSEVAVSETVPANMPTVSLTSDAPSTLAAPAIEPKAVSVIDDDDAKDAKRPLLLLGGAVSLLFGAGVIRRVVEARRRRRIL